MKHSRHSHTTTRALMERPSLAVVARPGRLPEGVAPEAEASRQARIRAAAYALYEARGCVPGHDVEDWLAAEAALASEATGTAQPVPGPAH